MSGVAVLTNLLALSRTQTGLYFAHQDWSISVRNLSRVVQDNNLGVERSTAGGRVVLRVTGDVATADLLDGNVLHVEADVVTGETLLFMS